MALDSWGVRRLRFQIEGEGDARSVSLPASQVISLGRDPECQVVLPAQEVSRQHLAIFLSQGQLFVRDQSARGTRLAGQHVHMSVRRLALPARLEVGPYHVHVALVGAVPKLTQTWARPVGRLVLVATAALSLLALFARSLQAPPNPTVAAAACSVGAPQAAREAAAISGPVSVRRAVEALRAGRQTEALALYRMLSADEDSPAALGVVAGLLAYELSCPR
jgi:predicted component of type VI protein secretion system